MKWLLPSLGVMLAFSPSAEAFHPLAVNQPRVCRARANKDMIELRYFRGTAPFAMDATVTYNNDKGEPYPFTFKMTKQTFIEQQMAIEAAHVDGIVDGKKIAGKELAALLAKETPVLACSQMPDADLLKIVKKGTLLLLVPISLDHYGYGSYGGPGTIEVVPAPGPGPAPVPVPPPGGGTIPPKGT